MRTEQEMMALILSTAEQDDRVRAVFMNGSRANPRVDKDIHRDYDIVYVVTETASFLADKGWIGVFGDLAMAQEPDAVNMGWGMDHDPSRSYTWLMLFTDGNRIDLHIETVEAALKTYGSDSLTVPLLDKDGLLPPLPPSDDTGYRIARPKKPQYDGCCNEFWWCLNNVAKGLVRRQLPYAMRIYTGVVLPELERMTAWYIGTRTDFGVSAGKWGKYFQRLLPPALYERFAATYSDGDEAHLWEAMFTACALFRELARAVGSCLGYPYPERDDANMTRYLLHMQEIYDQPDKAGKLHDTENS